MPFPIRIFPAVFFSMFMASGEMSACEWKDSSHDEVLEILSGHCSIPDLSGSAALDLQGKTLHVVRSVVVKPGAALTLSGVDVADLRLRSGSSGFASIVAEGSLLRIENISISSYDPANGRPDTNLQDGRSFIRVESFLRPDGTAALGRLEVTGSAISYLGYDSRFDGPPLTSTYGLSLKVLSESDLHAISTTGFIRSSNIHNNYRGFYSYGASGFVIEDSRFFQNLEYGVDGHDDTDQFMVRRNEIFGNGGTGLICSRRCSSNLFAENTVYSNGANGIMLHDLSNMGIIENNIVRDNSGDGIVIHDSHSAIVRDNDVSGNRIGIRIFAGSVNTTIVDNRLGGNVQHAISLLEGNTTPVRHQNASNALHWNGRNLARHNDSRIWFVAIESNYFIDDASIRISGARGAVFRNNQFFGRQSFHILNSLGTHIDGGTGLPDLPGPASAFAVTEARPSRRISLDDESHVVLDGDVLQMPFGSGHFHLDVASDGTGILAHDDRGEVRVTEVVRLPITVQGGSARILAARHVFGRRSTLELTLSVDEAPLVLSLNSDTCQTSEWNIDGTPHYAVKNESVHIEKVAVQSHVEISCIR